MMFWAFGCAVSVLFNAWLFWLWKNRGRRLADLERSIAEDAARYRNLSDTLRENDMRMRGILGSPLVGMFTWDGDIEGAALQGTANPSLFRMLGLSLPAARPDASPGDYPCVLKASLLGTRDWAELRTRGQCGPIEMEYAKADGGKAELLVAAKMLEGNRGLCLAIDIGRIKEAKRELRISQERYRVLADGSPVGIWHCRPDGRTLYINPAMSAILELDAPDELMATDTSFYEFFAPEAMDGMRAEIAKRIRGEHATYETEVLGKWGKRTRVIVYGTPVLGPDGRLESMIGTFLDITERKREEEALRQSEERLRVAAECGNDLIYEWDMASGRMEWFGPLEERLGYAPGEITRSREAWQRLLHPDDREAVQATLQRHLRGRQACFQDYRIRCKDGRYRRWTDRGSAVWDEAGKPTKWIGATADVTEAKLAEEALRAKEEQLRQSQKLEAVGRLAGGIAHDFNNLLAAIMGYCELMLLRLEPMHVCRKEVGEILKGSDRAAALIRQLLAFSRQEIPQPKVINPNLIISSMEHMLRHLLEENIELRLQPAADTGHVRIDPVQLEQVMMNLVLNARDAMPKGGLLLISSGNVVLDGEIPGAYGRIHSGPHVRVSVADSGLGIGEDHLPHIFDPFYTTKDSGKGSGLGLSTVYGIITQNQGCVLVETQVGKGSVFSCYLPLTLEEPEREAEIKKVLRSSAMIPKTVLVVEDDDEVRGIVRDLLSQQGFVVLEARQGTDAVALLENYSQPVHLLLTDIMLPGMGGKELAQTLLRHLPHLRVLYMSGYTQDAAFREEISGGNKAFIQKPFSMGALIGKIREVLV